jgi:hypothetical protein
LPTRATNYKYNSRQLPLEYFDLVIDPRSRRLVGNPAHGGEHVLELI